VLVVALATAALTLPLSAAGAGQSPDFTKYQTIVKAMATMAGMQGKGVNAKVALGATQPLAARQEMVTPAGQQYQLLALQFMGDQAAADACLDIVKANPNIAGVNEFLICIDPINADLVALEHAMTQYELQIAQNSSPVTGPGPPPDLQKANAFVDYANAVGTASEIYGDVSNVKSWLSKGEEVIKLGPNGMNDVVLPQGAVYTSNLTGKSVVIYGSDEAKDAFTQIVANVNLPQQVQNFLAANPPQIPDLSSNFGGGYVNGQLAFAVRSHASRAPGRIVVAKARQGLPIAVGYAPPWLKTFTTALLNGRTAEDAGIAALLGTAPRRHPGGPMLARLRGSSGLNAKAAKALEAVLALQAGRPAKLKALNAALRAHPVARARVRALAALLAKSYAREPAVRAAAVRALAPPPTKGFHIVAVISAPFYAELSPRQFLTDPKRDGVDRKLAAYLASLAR
jgi:hypothetical protein